MVQDSSVGRALGQKARRNTDAGSIPQCGNAIFSPRVNFQCRLSYDVHTALLQLGQFPPLRLI